MSLKELVHALGTEVCSEERFGRYPDFAPAEETLGFADTSPALDGSRGIAFMCDGLRIRTEKKVIGRDYSDILSVELVPSYESPFADELVVRSHRKDVRISDFSLNKPALKLLIDSLCAEYNRMSEDEREDAYRECFTAAMEFYCDPSDSAPSVPEEKPVDGTLGAIALELLSVQDDPTLSRGEILSRYTEILARYIPAETVGQSSPHAFIPAYNAGEKFPPENEAVVFTDHYNSTAQTESAASPAEAFDEVVASEEIPLMDLPAEQPEQTDLSPAEDFHEADEPAPVESEFPEASEESEQPAEIGFAPEDFSEQSALTEAAEALEPPADFPEVDEPAPVESAFPEASEESEPAESVIPETPEAPEPYIKEERTPEPDIFNEVMESQNVEEMSRAQTLSFLKDSINEINSAADEDEEEEDTAYSPYTREPKSDDIYLIASKRLRELCEKGVLTPERMQTELKMSVQATAKNFTEIASNEHNIPHELIRRVRDLKRGSSMLQKYMALGEDIASRVMFFMLYQMLVYTDGIEKSYGSALKLGAFVRRFSDIEMTLLELNARVK